MAELITMSISTFMAMLMVAQEETHFNWNHA